MRLMTSLAVLAESLGHRFRNQAGDRIGRSAGRERHDHGDRIGGVVLRLRSLWKIARVQSLSTQPSRFKHRTSMILFLPSFR